MQPSRRFILNVKIEREEDGRWIAEVIEIPGVLAYGHSPDDAVERIRELAAQVMSDRMQNGEEPI
jgi:predicted RNase H-like HicB family nuclease